MTRMRVELMETALDAAQAHADFLAAQGSAGAVISFTGIVRAEPTPDGAKGIDHLYLDWYPGMSEASIREIAEAAAQRFDVTALTVLHRCGKVEAGAPIVFVAAASRHRRAAFEAADYAMDRLKSEAALWKREVGAGLDRWVEPRDADTMDLKRWEKE